MANITSANSAVVLTVPGVASGPNQLQGYSADDAFLTEPVETAETVMGVDGFLSAGWVPNPIRFEVQIMPDSPSNTIFDLWFTAERQQQTKLPASMTVSLPSVGKKYSLGQGYLRTMPPIPQAGKVLRARRIVIEFATISLSPQ